MEGDAKDETLPPGFRFHPTDEELITYYLQSKISDADFSCRAIGDVDLNKCEPWDLPGSYNLKSSFHGTRNLQLEIGSICQFVFQLLSFSK